MPVKARPFVALAQADRKLYREAVQSLIASQSNLTVIGAGVDDIALDQTGRLSSVVLDTNVLACGACVITTGTFLHGKIHVGQWTAAGRVGEARALSWRKPRSVGISPATAESRRGVLIPALSIGPAGDAAG